MIAKYLVTTLKRCFKINGYPVDWKQPHKRFVVVVQSDSIPSTKDISPTISVEQYQHLLTLLGEHEPTKTSTPKTLFSGKLCLLSSLNSGWIIDSGASDHICHDLSLFYEHMKFTSSQNTHITIPDGSKVPISHVGTVKLNNDITLDHVQYVPGFQFNLICMPKIYADMSCAMKSPLILV